MSNNNNNNRRQAFRWAVAEPDARGLLRIGKGEVLVRVVNESAVGFGLECDRNVAVAEGELARLTTNNGQNICRVVRVEHHDTGRTIIGLLRISQVEGDAPSATNVGILTRRSGREVASLMMTMLVAFGVGVGGMMGLTKFTSFSWKATARPAESRSSIPAGLSQRAAGISRQFNNLDTLNPEQLTKALKLTAVQQKHIDSIVDKLVIDLANVHIDGGNQSPETGSHLGLMMIRRAWMQLEGSLTPEQMARWDALLDGNPETAEAPRAGTMQASL